jgi:serine protease Do
VRLRLFLLMITAFCQTTWADEREVINKITNASVLIKTQLVHGFTEDEYASGRWTGSGFLIDKGKGWILTNAHVAMSGPAKLRVQFVDESVKHKAERVFVDSRHDIALLSVDPDIIPSDAVELSMDCGYKLKRGERVVSVGHPRGHEFTVTLGVLSGVKKFDADTDLYSSDVIVESGSSGSPVVSVDSGYVVGVSTAKYDDSDVGLLTPSRDACRISKLMEVGLDPSRPRLGFQFLIRDKELSSVIGQVFDEASEFRAGDEVIGIEGNFWDPEVDGDLEDNLRTFQAPIVMLDVVRSGSPIQVPLNNIKIGSLHSRKWVHFSGLTFTEAKHQDSGYRNNGKQKKIIRVQSVDDTHDDVTELAFDDYAVVLSIDGRQFESIEDFYFHLHNNAQGREVALIVRDYDMTNEWVAYPFEHTIKVVDLESNIEIPKTDPNKVL